MNGGKICFRTFQHTTNWAGEIQGKTACHGKIGFGPINQILKGLGIKDLSTTKELKEYWINNKSEANLLAFALFNDFVLVGGSFNIFIQDKTIDWKVSKLLGLLLLERIENQPKEIQDSIITELINYASSETKDSSIFYIL